MRGQDEAQLYNKRPQKTKNGWHNQRFCTEECLSI